MNHQYVSSFVGCLCIGTSVRGSTAFRQPREQREQSYARISFAESRPRSSIAQPVTLLIKALMKVIVFANEEIPSPAHRPHSIVVHQLSSYALTFFISITSTQSPSASPPAHMLSPRSPHLLSPLLLSYTSSLSLSRPSRPQTRRP